jgi:hypothetical protein
MTRFLRQKPQTNANVAIITDIAKCAYLNSPLERSAMILSIAATSDNAIKQMANKTANICRTDPIRAYPLGGC